MREVYEATGKQYSPIRLVGVRAEQLVDKTSAQLGLWDDAEAWREAEDVMDAATAKFGRNVLKPRRAAAAPSAPSGRGWGQRD